MAGTVGAYQQGAFSTPVNGTLADASEVLSNDNNVRTKHNSHDNDATIHIQSSVLASRPGAGTAQRVWVTTDGLRAYIDNGVSWDELAYVKKIGDTMTGNLTISSGGITVTGASTITGALSGITTLAGTGAISGFTSLTLSAFISLATTQQIRWADANNRISVDSGTGTMTVVLGGGTALSMTNALLSTPGAISVSGEITSLTAVTAASGAAAGAFQLGTGGGSDALSAASSAALTINGGGWTSVEVRGASNVVATFNSTTGVTIGNGLPLVINTGYIDLSGTNANGIAVWARQTLTTSTSSYGFNAQPVFSTGVTVAGKVFYGQLITANVAFTMTTGIGLHIDSASKGAASTITTLYGARIEATTAGSTNNYGLWVGAASGGSGTNTALHVDGNAVFAGAVSGITTLTAATVLPSTTIQSARSDGLIPMVSGSSTSSVANNALLNLEGILPKTNVYSGLLLVREDNGGLCLFLISENDLDDTHGQSVVAQIVSAGSGYSVTFDNANTTNVYWSGSNTRFDLQNKTGGTRTYRFGWIGLG